MANDHVKMFTEEYSPIAAQVGKQIGVSPTVLLAQWGVETDYGRKMPGHFNFGNIKDMSGAGTSAVDNKTKSKDNYVNFESPEAFGDYYAHMMRRLYPKALNAGDDITKYAQGLRTGVKGAYAEAENYEDAIRGAHKITSNFYAGAGDTEEPKKDGSPFEGYESESSKFKREQEEEARNKPPAANPEDQQGGVTAPDVGAGAGAIANLLFPPMTNPERAVKVDTGRAEEANITAQDRLDLARRNLQSVAPEGTESLEDSFRQSQGELERLKNEQKLAEARLKGLPKTAPVVEAPAPSSPFPQVARTGPASGAPVEGDSGVRNWTIKSAGQKHQMPEAILDMVTDQTKESPTGGKRLIEEDLKNIEKIKQLGAGDYGLVTTEGGVQLQLPPTTVAERQADMEKQNQANQAELERKTEESRIQQETQARLMEQQRLAQEAELERVRQQRAQAGQQHNALTGQVKSTAPLKRALTKAETDAEIASRKLARAQAQPNAVGRVLQNAGAGSAKMGALPRAVVGGGAGYIGVMSYQEALERFKAGDTSEGVLKALQAGAAGAALLPPAGKGMTRARGVGTLGTLGLGAVDVGRRLLRERPPEE
jgi:hypothetical protein